MLEKVFEKPTTLREMDVLAVRPYAVPLNNLYMFSYNFEQLTNKAIIETIKASKAIITLIAFQGIGLRKLGFSAKYSLP